MLNKNIFLAAETNFPAYTHELHSAEVLDSMGRAIRQSKIKALEKAGVFSLSDYWLIETSLHGNDRWHAYGAIKADCLYHTLADFCAFEDIRLTPAKVTAYA